MFCVVVLMLLCRQIFTSMSQFPFDFMRFADFPMGAVDLYVKRADVTFDKFQVSSTHHIGSYF